MKPVGERFRGEILLNHRPDITSEVNLIMSISKKGDVLFLILVLFLTASVLLIGSLFSESLAIISAGIFIFSVLSVIMSYSVSKDINEFAGCGLGNPLISLILTLTLGIWGPTALDSLGLTEGFLRWTPSFLISNPNLRQSFQLFGFSYTGAYVVEQFIIMSDSLNSRVAFFAGFIVALVIFGLQTIVDRNAAILVSLVIIVYYLYFIHNIDGEEFATSDTEDIAMEE